MTGIKHQYVNAYSSIVTGLVELLLSGLLLWELDSIS